MWAPHSNTVWAPHSDTVWAPHSDTVWSPHRDTVWSLRSNHILPPNQPKSSKMAPSGYVTVWPFGLKIDQNRSQRVWGASSAAPVLQYHQKSDKDSIFSSFWATGLRPQVCSLWLLCAAVQRRSAVYTGQQKFPTPAT